jgi:alkaline phosphatase
MGLNQVSTSVLFSKNDQFKKFSSIGLVITCSADNLITDSAASATAIATGYMTNNFVVGQDPQGKNLKTILEIAEKKKMSTGLVVSSSITHATPASFYAHVKHRNMEFDIAQQFVRSGIDFSIGGGTDFFLPNNLKGKREDNKNYFYHLTTMFMMIFQKLMNLVQRKELQRSLEIMEFQKQ